MAKYTVSIDEDTRQRVIALPNGVKFSAFMRKAIAVFIEELENDHGLKPDDFIIALKTRNNASDRKE